MIYSRSAEYAIRAFVHLAQVPEGQYAMVKQIAAEEEIPVAFPGQRSYSNWRTRACCAPAKARPADFPSAFHADDIRLVDIVEALDGLAEYEKCVNGLPECSDQHAVPASRLVESRCVRVSWII